MPNHAITVSEYATCMHYHATKPELDPRLRGALRSSAYQHIDVMCDWCNHHRDGVPQCWSCPIVLQIVDSIRA